MYMAPQSPTSYVNTPAVFESHCFMILSIECRSSFPKGLRPPSRPLPHYKLGDLGIVPRSKPILGPVHTKLMTSRETRSIGVQTFSAQKVKIQFYGILVICSTRVT